MPLPHCRAAALFAREIPARLCPTARHQQRLIRVRDELPVDSVEASELLEALSPLAASDAARSNFLPTPDGREPNRGTRKACCPSTVSIATQRHGRGNKASRDHSDAWPKRLLNSRPPATVVRFRF